jgi:hypothetical protein
MHKLRQQSLYMDVVFVVIAASGLLLLLGCVLELATAKPAVERQATAPAPAPASAPARPDHGSLPETAVLLPR